VPRENDFIIAQLNFQNELRLSVWLIRFSTKIQNEDSESLGAMTMMEFPQQEQ
jgi:hypothetical protein